VKKGSPIKMLATAPKLRGPDPNIGVDIESVPSVILNISSKKYWTPKKEW
jgi:hypothetical protein